MGDKVNVADVKISAATISDPIYYGRAAKRMAEELLRKEFRGPGDTIEGAAERLRRSHGLDPNILLQAWNRPPREMKTSRWLALFIVHWQEIASKTETAYETRRSNAVENHPLLVSLADLVAGRRS